MIHYIDYTIGIDNTAKNRKLNNLQLPIVILGGKSIISYIHHGIMYMYINFQQNRVSKSVKTVHINLFAKNRKSPKFATTNSNFEKSIISDVRHRKTYMYIIFQQDHSNRAHKFISKLS